MQCRSGRCKLSAGCPESSPPGSKKIQKSAGGPGWVVILMSQSRPRRERDGVTLVEKGTEKEAMDDGRPSSFPWGRGEGPGTKRQET